MKASSAPPLSLGSYAHDVYVSAARTDDASGMVSAVVRTLQAWHLEQTAQPLAVHWDPRPVESATDWTVRCRPELERSRLLLAFLTPDYFACPYCQADWEAFVACEQARKLKGRSLVAAYAITYPLLTTRSAIVRRELLLDLRRRKPIDVRADWGGGPRGLEFPEVRATFGGVADALAVRLEPFATAANDDVPCPAAADIPPLLAGLPADARKLLDYAVHLPPDAIVLSWLRTLVAYGSDELHGVRRKGVPDAWQRTVKRLRSQGLVAAGKSVDRITLPAPVRDAVWARLPEASRAQFRSLVAMHLLERASHFSGGDRRESERAELIAIYDVALERVTAGDFLGVTLGQLVFGSLERLKEDERLRVLCDLSLESVQEYWRAQPQEPRLGNLLALSYQKRSELARRAGDEHGEMRYLMRCRETLEELQKRGLPLNPHSEKLRIELEHLATP